MRKKDNGAEQPVLIGQTGPLNGQRFVIRNFSTIGRDASCEIVIPDRQVSRFHARLSVEDTGVILEDLASKNGTFHNGKMIGEPVVLQDGDLIQIALVQSFAFISSDTTMPIEAGAILRPPVAGRLRLDARSRRVWIGQKEILPPLSVPQFRLLQTLYDQPGQVVSRNDLITTIWEDEAALGVSDQALDALVRRLRDRLAELDKEHQYIVTVRGYGLRLDNHPE
ncbi:MAG: FHA domain-containing protein [Anaerolineae bacterium]|nr:FHA domain-containing protein [Anaerolineae bacterium]